MKLSKEKQQEINQQVTKCFEEFKTKRGLIKSTGRIINPLELLEKIKVAEEFAQECKISVHYSNDGELQHINSLVNFEIQIVINDIVDNY